jgi:hypothetical protein
MNNAQLGEAEEAIGFMLFGEDVYRSPNARVRLMKPNLQEFVQTLLSYLWNQIRKSTKRHFAQLKNGKDEATDEFESG